MDETRPVLNALSAEALGRYTTEQPNEASRDIDSKSALEIVTIINNEDRKVPIAVEKILPEIAALVDDIVAAFKKGGRLIYIGAGTSGRLGVLDASECPPTYGVDPGMVRGLIAGGREALTASIEAAEDRAGEGVKELEAMGFSEKDVLVGITASGQAPYVLGALDYARGIGAVTAAISSNADSKTFDYARHRLYVDVGPEVVTGSTRMKSGTAQKLVLNMLTTAAMIRVGKVYRNLMVDLKPVNHKLMLRSLRLIREVTGCSENEARSALEASARQPKIAIVMVLLGVDMEKAGRLLEEENGHISAIMEKRKSGLYEK
ncbi:MAG: N-acetylmuramic acid 6-phosphate etherase [Treponema sp.]|jgi:N-acetylmuramic acid 6-phosphate etherase|nr:N-acetylmuramic acid 6-phosphate etherase [Treponema sp.]